MSSAFPSGVFTLRSSANKGRSLEAAKFRERVPALESTSGTAVPRVVRKTTGRISEQSTLLQAGGKKYEGTREVVGASTEQASEYLVVRIDTQNGVMTASPLSAWYTFRPAITHATRTLDEAEALIEAKNRKAERLAQKVRRKDEEDDDDDGKGGKGKRGGSSGSGGRAAGMMEDEDFDDGAGPEWAGAEGQDEDGNDGLDMEDEDQFDDDEDDGFGDDDAIAFDERQKVKEHALLQRVERMAGARSGDVEEQGEALAAAAAARAEEEDEIEGQLWLASEWGRRTKEDLKAERKALRDKWDSDDSDDEELLDEGAEALEKLLKAEVSAPPAEEGAAASTAAAPATAGSKRAMSPENVAEEAAKRAKQNKETAAQIARTGRRKVEEKDVVLLLHKKGKMSLKELIGHFKAYMAGKQDRDEFIAIVKSIAYVSVEGSGNVAKLKEATLGRYGLE